MAEQPAPDDAIRYGTVLDHPDCGTVMVIARGVDFSAINLSDGGPRFRYICGNVYSWSNYHWDVIELGPEPDEGSA